MEKKSHAQSNTVYFAETIFLSGQAGGELCLFKKVRRRLTNLQVCDTFVSLLRIFALECFCVSLLQIIMACMSLDNVNVVL